MRSKLCVAAFAAIALLSVQRLMADTIAYGQNNLTSDLPGVAPNQDTNLVNPWGIAFGAGSPVWISDNGTGLSTLYNGSGQAFPVGSPLVVTVPPPNGGTPPSAPTGVIANPTGDFGGSHFIFATEDGTISAWSGGTSAALEVDNSPSGAIYKGLAMGNNGANLLYAANFNSGNIDVFNASFAPTTVPGGFTDPTLPAGYAPFDIANIGGLLYVTYAQQDADKHDDVAGPGNGYVDVYNTNGVLQHRLISNGPLNSPWGMTLAPGSFGPFSNDLLVGNFGDGKINAFDPTTGALLGTLENTLGQPIVNQGLWGLAFGDGAHGFDPNTLYFTAGIPGPGEVEDHGLFGDIRATPEPSALLPSAAVIVGFVIRRRFRAI